jgi:hypothetical protein
MIAKRILSPNGGSGYQRLSGNVLNVSQEHRITTDPASWTRLGAYILDTSHAGEKVAWARATNCGSEDPGWAVKDTGGEGDAGGMSLADFYMALSKRFDKQSKAVYSQGGGESGHWDTLMMLLRPLPEGCNIGQIRSAMFMIFNDVATALELLEEYSEDIMKAWKRANAPSREDEERAR